MDTRLMTRDGLEFLENDWIALNMTLIIAIGDYTPVVFPKWMYSSFRMYKCYIAICSMIVIFYVYCMFTCLVVSIISSRKHMSSDQFALVISAAYGGLCIEQATVINQSCHYWLLEGCSPVPHKTYLSFLYVTCNYDIPGSSKCVKRSAFW